MTPPITRYAATQSVGFRTMSARSASLRPSPLPHQCLKMPDIRTDTHDVHVWRFVPSSFRLILRDLAEIGQIGLRERLFHDSVGNEFYAALSRTAPECPIDRLTLAKQAVAEQVTIVLGIEA